MSTALLIGRVRARLLNSEDEKRAQRFASLIDSEAFKNVAAAACASAAYTATDDAETRLTLLVMWLDLLSIAVLNCTLDNGRTVYEDIAPHELLGHIREKRLTHDRNVQVLREIAASLTPKHSEPLSKLVDEIEADRFALKGYGLGDDLVAQLLSEDNIGKSGAAASSAANPQGTWRGWIIRSLYHQLPPMHEKQKPFATMRDLLAWAGLDVENYDVASIVARERRRS